MALVIKIGGHLISSGGEIDIDSMKSIAKTLMEAYQGDEKWVVVVGGGDGARKYIDAARAAGADEATCDSIAIAITRVHAMIFIQFLQPHAHPTVPTDLDYLKEALSVSRMVVVGGLWPGQSTFAVAALCAQAARANRMIVATDVDGIYDSDPRVNPNARRLRVADYDTVKRLLLNTSHAAGAYKLIDSVGLSVAERSRMRLLFVNGRDREMLKAAILRDEAGTVVTAEGRQRREHLE
ncbi:MAG: UMP kinase [Aigarchaeota archaeon]|nr:UMP kinase [Aigarchaeota archaeon]MDW8092467.1 UMP kinase [Nitrososphaerota archaeon]